MKSPIISHVDGFLIGEVMIAFVIATLFLTSAFVLSATNQKLYGVAKEKLEGLDFITKNIASTTLYSTSLYGNFTAENKFQPITISKSDYANAWGRETCDPRFALMPDKIKLHSKLLNIGMGNASTDLEVRNGIVYLTADSSQSAAADLFIFDFKKISEPKILSSLNTGPGLSAIEVAGPYIYAANLGTTNQLQIIEISNRLNPTIISRYKLPLPHPSSTPPLATSIFYNKGLIYLGTEKWEGNEFSIIDVHIPTNPIYLGGFKTNTQINNIYIKDAQAFVAASDQGQMRVLDISNPSFITQQSQFSPSGWETQQGKIVTQFEDNSFLGRTTGGFNVTKNHELFAFSTSTNPDKTRDMPGGIYGVIAQPEYVIAATHDGNKEMQVLSKDLSSVILSKSLGFSPTALECDNNTLFFTTGDEWGIGVMEIN